MTRGLPAAQCSSCDRLAFPARVWCPECGGTEWRRVHVDSGVVEDVTVLRRTAGRPGETPVRIGSVRLEDGEIVVVRLAPGAGAGDRVRLESVSGAPVAYPPG